MWTGWTFVDIFKALFLATEKIAMGGKRCTDEFKSQVINFAHDPTLTVLSVEAVHLYVHHQVILAA